MEKPVILVVDDDREIAGLIARFLTLEGYGVEMVCDFDAAAVYLKHNRIDLLLTDFDLGDPRAGRDGLGLLRMAREIDPALPVIVHSGSVIQEQVAAAIGEGAFAYLPKPVDLLALREKVAEAGRWRRAQELRQKVRVPVCAIPASATPTPFPTEPNATPLPGR